MDVAKNGVEIIDTHLLAVEMHDTKVFPDLPSLDCTFTAHTDPDVFSTWAEIEDNTAETTIKLTAKFASYVGHITAMAIEYMSVNSEICHVELAYGASHIEICNFRIRAGTNNLPVTQVPRVRGAEIPTGETIYYRMSAETGEASMRVNFRYYLEG